MKRTTILALAIAKVMTPLCLLFCMASCSRHPGELWDDTKSCGRHMLVGINKLSGHNPESRQVSCKEEFMGWHDDPYALNDMQELEFVPMMDERDGQAIAMVDRTQSQPHESPGCASSCLPGIDGFEHPAMMADTKHVFLNVHFDYNSNQLNGQRNLDVLMNISNYMKTHPNTYIFVEGHCDERGPESYNMALGMRRSNAVRNLLIQQGVNGEQIFTISYGKERPLNRASNEDAWQQNRRAEFKIYRK